MIQQDSVLVFLQSVTPRVGPLNAMNLLKDAYISAFVELFKELGLSEKKITEVIDGNLKKTAQNILNVPTPSPLRFDSK